MRYVPKYALKSATGYSLYSAAMPVSIALEQWQLAKTRYRNRQNKGCNRIRETYSMTKEYCTQWDRYGAISEVKQDKSNPVQSNICIVGHE